MEMPEEYWTDALLFSMAGKYTEYATGLLVGDDTTYRVTKRRLLQLQATHKLRLAISYGTSHREMLKI